MLLGAVLSEARKVQNRKHYSDKLPRGNNLVIPYSDDKCADKPRPDTNCRWKVFPTASHRNTAAVIEYALDAKKGVDYG
ncbi:hypothetical protein BH10CYA1_BH10CYA1_13920 [soil metagenome]